MSIITVNKLTKKYKLVQFTGRGLATLNNRNYLHGLAIANASSSLTGSLLSCPTASGSYGHVVTDVVT